MQEIRDKIYEVVYKIGPNKTEVPTEILADTLYYRLTIMRLGEEDNNAWLESCILGEVGRRNLEKFFPNTFTKQRYDIALKIVTDKEEREIHEKRYTTLFNFGYKFETEIFKPFAKEITKSDEWADVLNMIEKIRGVSFKSPWVREFFGIPKMPVVTLKNENVMQLGNIPESFYIDKNSFNDTVKSFLAVYDLCSKGRIVIPYYKRRLTL